VSASFKYTLVMSIIQRLLGEYSKSRKSRIEVDGTKFI